MSAFGRVKRTLVKRSPSAFSGTGLSRYAWGLGAAMKRRTKKSGKAKERSRRARHNAPTTARERDEALEQLSATSKVLKVISRSTYNLQTVLDTVVEAVTRLCEAYDSVVFLRQGERLHVKAHYGPILLDFGDGPIGRGWVTGRAFVDQLPIQVHDLQNSARDFPDGSKMALRTQVQTTLSVPLLTEDDAIGALTIRRNEVKPFTERQVELVNTFAAQAVIAIENARLLNELRQRTDDLSESLEQQTATSAVLKVISSTPGELGPVFQAILENATRICEAQFGTIYRCEGDAVRCVGMHNAPKAFAEERRGKPVIRPAPATVFGRALATKRPCQIADIRDEIQSSDGPSGYTGTELARLAGARTVLAVPMLKDDELVGAIVIYRQQVCTFTDKQTEVLVNFAAQAVIAIENARLLNELRESLQQQTATSDVLKVISSSPGELEPVFSAMLEKAVQICGANFGNLFVRDGDAFRIGAFYGAPPAYAEFLRTERVFPFNPKVGLGQLATTKKTYQVDDISTAPTHGDKLREATINLGGARTVIGLPMLKDGQVVGAIVIYRQEARPFTDKQIDLVQNFAAQAVIAIENARLLNELRQRTDDLSESLEQQTATSEVLAVISGSVTDAQPVFDMIADSAAKLCDAQFCFVYRFDGQLLHFVAHRSVAPEVLELNRRNYPAPPTRATVASRAILERSVVQVPDVAADSEYVLSEMATFAGYRSAVGVPILRDGVPIGAIAVTRAQAGLLPDRQIELLKTFADQAVIAIENVRLFDEVQTRTRDLAESLQQQTATADVLKTISRSTFDLPMVLDALIETATRMSDADQGAITREIDGSFFRAASYGYSSALSDFICNTPVQMDRGSIAGRALVERRVVQILDIKADPEYNFSPALESGDFRTALGVPMLREGVPIGVLSLTRRDVRPFSDKQIELASTFADQAAIAIENVRLFDEVQARTRDLTKSLDELRSAQDRLVQTEKLASLGQLTAGIAHEIKNPLNFVNNFSGISAELIGELQQTLSGLSISPEAQGEIRELTDTLRSNLEKVVQHGRRADAIVKSMLMHSGESSGRHQSIDINALVEESLNRAYYNARAEQRGFAIKLEKSFDPAAGEALMFPREITRALLNLISNGFYAATKRNAETKGDGYEPTLGAATKNLGDRVEIRIRDNGTGIPADVKEKMFDPFFTTKPAGEGTGLGLSISHDIIVKQHGGSIEVDTEPGEFAEIRVILPRASGAVS